MRKTLLLSLFVPAVFAAERPNIVFIFSDDHAQNAISAYGGPLKEAAPTPNLDRIADEGAIFTRSFCCNSICGPSRAAILTGKHSHINGYLDNNNSKFDGNQTTFPKLLQKVGYQTAMVGKWHLVSDPQGFDYWEILPGQGSYYNPDFYTAAGKTKYSGYCTDIITDRAIKWLDEDRAKDKPFVLMCQHKAPHRNWAPAPRHLTLFDDMEMPEPDTLFDDYANRDESLKKQAMSIEKDFSWGHDMKLKGENQFPDHFTSQMKNGEYFRMNDEQKAKWDAAYEPKNQQMLADLKSGKLKGKDITRWKYQRYIKDYLRCIRAVDENVGRLLDHLDKTGLSKNTIVIYSSDQGFYLGEHGWYDKRWMFEESLEMPFLIRWPGVIKPGSKSDALIQNIDYAPTFLEIGGAEIPETVQGRSMLPILKASGETPEDWREGIYYFYSGERTHAVAAHDGVRNGRYKLMHFPATDSWNLFDLEKDPKEMKSFHDDPEYAAVLSEMKLLYDKLRDQYQASDATLPGNRFGEKWWKDRHQAKMKESRKGDYDLVFVGDSITQGWEGAGKEVWEEFYGDRKALNLGFSGDRTEHVMWRLLAGEIDKVDPKVYVLMIGTNNTGHRQDDPDKTAAGVELIVEMLRDRDPDAKVLLLAVFPRDEKPDGKLRKINDGVNSRIKELADGKQVHWLDISDKFLTEEGVLTKEVMPDFLHPKGPGYRIWAEAMEPKLKELLGE
ncbi:acetylglucosamine-6-sulfatase [Haloferula helveola]|uniref:Acetylglucosamine-6-sulfatase n=1 Tax=Haloferula helveola TaxID=490095 RepID=A0ABM7RNA3_9BACT|nr:acetylglucosamine-6-sulfatase [Haloferula helveola]